MIRIIIEVNDHKKSGLLIESRVEHCKEEPTNAEKRVTFILRGLISIVMDDAIKMLPGLGKKISESDAETLKSLTKIDL